jgi:nucleotide-binding universal stress UspA family protein
VNRLRGKGLRAEGALRFGSVADEIFAVALEREVDVIVTGTRGRKGFARAWYGSIAEQIIRGSAVPVLAVPEAIDNVLRFKAPACRPPRGG